MTLHMFRRGFATLAHASAATTANVYVQAVPESAQETVEKMDRALCRKATAAKEKT